MVITLPGSPFYYRTNLSTSLTGGVTATVAVDSGSGRAYLTKLLVTFDASAVGKWWIFQGTTATVMLGPFYANTVASWFLDFAPNGYPVTTTSLDIGYGASTSGLFTFNMMGYTV